MSMENENSKIPDLTLDPQPEMGEVTPELVLAPNQPDPAMVVMEQSLSDEEQRVVHEFAQQIDITNATQVLQYGITAQKKISSFSESALENVRAKDMEGVGEMITGLLAEVKGFSEENDPKGFFGLFKRQGNKAERYKSKYDSVAKNVDRIVDQLENHKVVLLKDVAMLDKMYEMNLGYYKELTLYILAGREKLTQIETVELPALQQKAKESGRPEDAQNANFLADMCNRFDKKLYDLDLTRNICIQMGPQIRLVQSNDSMMVEKIQSSIVNTIPLWKNQMVLSLGLAHSQNAIQAQRQVTDVTNELLKKNAETLKVSTIEAARESERGIVDIETLKQTNESLITTLDEVLKIQEEGRQKRREAEAELQQIESDIKNKLLEIRDARDQRNAAQ